MATILRLKPKIKIWWLPRYIITFRGRINIDKLIAYNYINSNYISNTIEKR